MEPLGFTPSVPLTLGVEVELQLVNGRDCDLTRGASDLLAVLERSAHPGEIKPEITESMIELATSVQQRHVGLLTELRAMRDAITRAADLLNLRVAGGGTHPFQHWNERKIYDRPRFRYLNDLYGYLAKQFTVFGVHVHVGCANGDDALYLTHAMSRFIPHFIALAASSPYYQGVDTAFDSSRLNAIYAFPLSGRAPFMTRWSEFEAYFDRMRGFGIVESMKDFYWDIRPKPEFGTIEIRVCDTPLTIDRVAAIAVYAQALARYLLVERPFPVTEDLYVVYNYNRFQACRFGLDGTLVDPLTQTHATVRDDIAAIGSQLGVHARELEAEEPLWELARLAREGGNDAQRMRETYASGRSLADVVWWASECWRGAAG